MAQKRATAKTSKINRTSPVSSSLVERYCRGLDDWPHSWMGWEKDLPPGEELVASFRPFLEHLVRSALSPKTIQTHVDNLWLLGGEVIRHLNQDPSLRKLPAERLLQHVIGDDGGPLVHNGSEEEQSSFDSTCRKLHRFLSLHSARQPAARGKGHKTRVGNLQPRP
jgi:hypothetical protein